MIKEPSLQILPALDEECDRAAELFASSEPWKTLGITYENANAMCHDPRYLVYIAHIEHKPCGVIILDPRGVAGVPYIKSILVEEKYRSHGIGAALIAFAENFFKQTSPHLFLCVSSSNQRARSFYERLNYRVIGELRDHIKEGESEILMYKRIS
ncbi:MAG TPA: GNAT family N-acetyltransferase [Chitinophagaceae bacterium]|jgi:ribosomal protein S18 acetylase RimI-like enzyme